MSIMTGLQGSMGILIGAAIGLAFLALLAGMGFIGDEVQRGITSAARNVAAFLSIIGLGVAVGLISAAMGLGGRRR